MRAPPVVALAASLALTRAAAAVDPVARPSSGLRLAGAALAAGGVAVALAGVAAFRRHRTTVDPRYPERASALVTGGVYRWTRNPMYLGMAAGALGWAAWHGTPLGIAGPALLVGYLDRVQVAAEEGALRARFPGEFEAYAGAVRRWIGRRGPGDEVGR